MSHRRAGAEICGEKGEWGALNPGWGPGDGAGSLDLSVQGEHRGSTWEAPGRGRARDRSVLCPPGWGRGRAGQITPSRAEGSADKSGVRGSSPALG